MNASFNAISLLAALTSARGRARERTLDGTDIIRAIAQHEAMLATAEPDDIRATTTLRGGFVPNSYKYRADSDEVRIVSVRASANEPWTTTATALRTWAQRRPSAKGDLCIGRLARVGQTDGRIAA